MLDIFLTILRNKDTPAKEFREAAKSAARILLLDASKELATKNKEIKTPLGTFHGKELGSNVVLVLILRAGLAFLEEGLALFPNAAVGMLGIKRDEKTALPHLYYQNLPSMKETDRIFLLDPMLATGKSAELALKTLQEAGANLNHTTFISIVASQEGKDWIAHQFPQITLTLGAIDETLNAQKFILPGLGDFGDRYFSN